MKTWLTRLLNRSHGATTAEYALLLALVVIVLISTLTELGAALRDKLQQIILSLGGAQ
ncbi:MAG: Flp family type IVb pilin [Bacillota bacterium]